MKVRILRGFGYLGSRYKISSPNLKNVRAVVRRDEGSVELATHDEGGGNPSARCKDSGNPAAHCEGGADPAAHCEGGADLATYCEGSADPAARCEGSANPAAHEGGAMPYWESFDYDGPMDTSVAGLLDYLNYHDDLVNDQGERSDRIAWDCSCLQGVCGACAMVINGVPALACETFLKDIKGDELELRPLQKFPVAKDLVVDRSSIHENLMRNNVYIGEYMPSDDKDHEHQYAAAKCLKCGLCLEVCPNYVNGSMFFGAAFANDCYLVAARNHRKSAEVKEIYGKHFGAACSKSLSCMDVCPMKIPTLASIAKLNRL